MLAFICWVMEVKNAIMALGGLDPWQAWVVVEGPDAVEGPDYLDSTWAVRWRRMRERGVEVGVAKW